MNSVLEEYFQSGTLTDSEGNPVEDTRSPVSYEAGKLLYDLVRREGAGRTLEVGLGRGISALFLLQAHHDKGGGHHTAMDPLQESHFKSTGVANVERAGLGEHFRFFQAPSYEVLPRLWLDGERFDFAFIDGAHLFDYALVDFFYVDKLLEVGGLVAIDDLWILPVRQVVSFVLRNRNYELIRPPSITPLWRRVLRTGRRFLQNPVGLDLKLKLIPENVALLRKLDEDTRRIGHRRYLGEFHRRF